MCFHPYGLGTLALSEETDFEHPHDEAGDEDDHRDRAGSDPLAPCRGPARAFRGIDLAAWNVAVGTRLLQG